MMFLMEIDGPSDCVVEDHALVGCSVKKKREYVPTYGLCITYCAITMTNDKYKPHAF